MLTGAKLKLVQDLIATSTREELIWLNGYLAGKVSAHPEKAEAATADSLPLAGRITIAYGTESGNSKKLATEFATRAKKSGLQAKLVSLDQYRLSDLSREEYFFAVISTQGEGEPPAAAKKFYDHIHRNGFRLDNLKYGVLALGDTAYPLFCKAGEDVDAQLQRLGAERILPLQKCDLDFESDASQWFGEILGKLANSPVPKAISVDKKPAGRHTLNGTILTNLNLNDRDSEKETHHIEIAAEDLHYSPGDSMGIIPENPHQLVETILHITGTPGHKPVNFRNEKIPLGDLLRKKLNILHLPERVVKKYAALVQQEIPETRMGLADLLKIYPVKDAGQWEEVIEILEPMAPRLYSISSSPAAHGSEIHLTVARDRFPVNGEWKFGLCSDMLCQLAPEQTISFYIHRNAQFRLPAPEKDIIMIGPGTGIAPFRAFLAERDATGANGRNWLFFGDRRFSSDFLYQTEFQDLLQRGVLTRINTAFSRDQKNKVYVQHKMLSHGAALYEWIAAGAYVYVCGAKEPMSVDVENTLLSIFSLFGNKSETEAQQYLDQLREEGRYLKDVY